MQVRFGILLGVRKLPGHWKWMGMIAGGTVLLVVCAWPGAKRVAAQAATGQGGGSTAAFAAQTPQGSPQAGAQAGSAPPSVPQATLNVVVLDPAHGGTDLGARGTEGIRESEVVLEFAAQIKKALQEQGFQVVQTREGNDNPSFDDRSARANAQRGAVFVTLHVASTGLAGTARVYVSAETPQDGNALGLIPWDQAQVPFAELSRKLGNLVQTELTKTFKGSPATALVAPVRQLRTTAAPAIAVEISSVSVVNRSELDRMVPGVAEAITRGIVTFRPTYVVPMVAGPTGSTKP